MKGLRGEITVFLTLLLLLFLGFFTVLLERLRVEGARTAGERSLNLGLSSVFTEYYEPLWKEYHLFGLSPENLEGRVREYMLLSYGLSCKELTIEEIVWGTDYDGKIFLHQIEAYERYRSGEALLERNFVEKYTEAADKVLAENASKGEAALPEDWKGTEEGREERRKMGSLKAVWGRSIMEMVLDNPAELSAKKLKGGPAVGEGRYSFSSTRPEKNLGQVKRFLQKRMVEEAELRYYREHFKSYCKKTIEFQRPNSLLDYELEYLMEGKKSDRDNMEAWLRRLVLTRTTLNYLMINQDSQKSQMAYEMALTALGFTGLEPLIRAGQQFILLGWGYEEALVDVCILLQGGQVSLWKGAEEFSISFGELFSFSKEMVRRKARERKIEGIMDYEAYLSLFLSFKKEQKRRQAAWYLIDENIRLRYGEEFSLQDTVFGVHMRAEYQLPGKLGRDWILEAKRHYSY
ncbi:DUF5702 domain-containing protein [Acetivibrio ethanolgignens]|uniref:Uncharacterized protein n=1 Tax=Acetivibrio ethanolgignens TaxID=290052 RepID=A0A0V8QF35_9FIRM|nr:DUF5702 domain-containing protein [Acetivibrio ethanolgignens]KSV59229.1 hypothetical protein ASU35_09915 [Acetivibrio ethanolgignens]